MGIPSFHSLGDLRPTPTSFSRRETASILLRFLQTAAYLSLAVFLSLIGSGCSGGIANSVSPPPPVQHSVTLTWTASVSDVIGYRVYRSSVSGGPYSLLLPSPVSGTTFLDTSVQAGQSYFYVVTSVDTVGIDSAYSSEVSATVPAP